MTTHIQAGFQSATEDDVTIFFIRSYSDHLTRGF